MSDEYAKRLRQAADEIAKAGHYGWGNTCVFAADHIERLTAELKDLRDEAEHYDDLIARQGALLRGVVNAIKGPPPDDTLWSHHDAPELAAGVMAELEALRADADMMLAALRKAVLALAHADAHAPGLYTEYYDAVSAALEARKGAA